MGPVLAVGLLLAVWAVANIEAAPPEDPPPVCSDADYKDQGFDASQPDYDVLSGLVTDYGCLYQPNDGAFTAAPDAFVVHHALSDLPIVTLTFEPGGITPVPGEATYPTVPGWWLGGLLMGDGAGQPIPPPGSPPAGAALAAVGSRPLPGFFLASAQLWTVDPATCVGSYSCDFYVYHAPLAQVDEADRSGWIRFDIGYMALCAPSDLDCQGAGTWSFVITLTVGTAPPPTPTPAPELPLVVNSVLDRPDIDPANGCDTGVEIAAGVRECTFRAAIQTAESTPGRDVITFAIPTSGVPTVAPMGLLPEIHQSVVIDGSTQPAGFVRLSGAIAGGPGSAGLRIAAGNSEVRGLVIGGWGDGIVLSSLGNNVIAGNRIGTGADGNTADPNGFGVTVLSGEGNRIGGAGADGNLISGNGAAVDVFAARTRILGNVIGLGASGNSLLGGQFSAVNTYSSLNEVRDNTIVVGTPPEGSLHTGVGVSIAAVTEAVTGNIVDGNRIGLSLAGEPLGIGLVGVEVASWGAPLTLTTVSNNTVAPYRYGGIAVAGEPVSATTIAENRVGVNGDGSPAPAAPGGPGLYGIRVEGSDNTAVTGNRVAATSFAAVAVNGVSQIELITLVLGSTTRIIHRFRSPDDPILGTATASGNTVSGNTIGPAPAGIGVLVSDGAALTTVGPGNSIGGFDSAVVVNDAATGTRVVGNTIGSAVGGPAGTTPERFGVAVENAPGSRIGTVAEPNVVGGFTATDPSGDGGVGIVVVGSADVHLTGNRIGTNAVGALARPNGVGVSVHFSRVTQVLDNQIASSVGVGVFLDRTTEATVARNTVGTNAGGTAALPNGLHGVHAKGGSQNNVLDNLVSGNAQAGVFIEDETNATASGNTIGTNRAGASPLPNGLHGLHLRGGLGHVLRDNLLSGNTLAGLALSATTNPRVFGNTIGANRGRLGPVPNENGIWAEGDNGAIRIGGPGAEGNVIAGNLLLGAAISGGAGHVIEGNWFGTDPTGAYPGSPAGSHLDVRSVAGATVARNIIIGGQFGVLVTASAGVRITENRMIGVQRLGIELAPPAGQNGDLVAGSATANAGIAAPRILSATPFIVDGGTSADDHTDIEVDMLGAGPYRLELFRNVACKRASGASIFEGGTLIAARSTAGGALKVVIPGVIIDPETGITATITDGAGNTSEFSSCLGVATWEVSAALTSAVPAGATTLPIASTTGFAVGDHVELEGGTAAADAGIIDALGSLILDRPLLHPHAAGAIVTKLPAGTDLPPYCSGVSLATAAATPAQGTLACVDEVKATLSFTVQVPPAHGQAVLLTGGQFRYTPTPGFSGKDSFVLTATDAGGHVSNGATISVTVAPGAPSNRVPTCAARTLSVATGGSAEVSPLCIDLDNDSLTYAIASQGTKGTASVVSGQLRYVANVGTVGQDTFTYTASDGKGGASAPAPVTVTVQGALPLRSCAGSITYTPLAGTFVTSRTAVPNGPAGTFRFMARMTNRGTTSLTDLTEKITTLTNGNKLLSADNGAGVVGDIYTIPKSAGYADGILSPGESVDIPHSVGLAVNRAFTLFVDVLCRGGSP